MRDSSYASYNDLFEEIANRHPEIAWFHEIDEAEIIAGDFRSRMKYPLFVLEYPSFGFNDNRTNVDHDIPAAFLILKNISKTNMGNRSFLKQVMSDTNRMTLDVISYLREVRRTGERLGVRDPKHHIWMETNNVKKDKVGPWGSDNCYGWRVELRYRQWVDLNFYPDEWNDYNPDKWT